MSSSRPISTVILPPVILPPVILQVLPALQSGGVERGTVEVARAIRARGWTPLVASAGGRLEGALRHAGGEHITLPLKSKNPFVLLHQVRKLEMLIREHRVSLIHARSRAPAWSAWLAARRTGIPLITTFHGAYGLQNRLKKHYNAVMLRGQRVIAISHFIREHILTHYGDLKWFDPAVLRLVPRGADIASFNPSKVNPLTLAELARKWRVPDDVPVIMLPGRITRWKGHDVLIRALHALPHRDFFCILAGDDADGGRFRAELENLIMALGLGAHVRFVGYTDQMPAALMMAQVVVIPSTEPEAFGRVAVEAQAMERPVIASRHGGTCETVIDGVTGWLCESGNPSELTEALGQMLALPHEARVAMGVAGRRHVCEEFTTARMCERTLAVYEELLTSNASFPEGHRHD